MQWKLRLIRHTRCDRSTNHAPSTVTRSSTGRDEGAQCLSTRVVTWHHGGSISGRVRHGNSDSAPIYCWPPDNKVAWQQITRRTLISVKAKSGHLTFAGVGIFAAAWRHTVAMLSDVCQTGSEQGAVKGVPAPLSSSVKISAISIIYVAPLQDILNISLAPPPYG